MATNTGGRPAFEPTAEQRQNVEIAVGLGIPQTDICLMVRGPKGKPINKRTLEKHFRHEIDTGATNLRAQVGNFMISVIKGSDPPPGFAPIRDEKVRGSLIELFAAAQLNWRKTVRTEHANAAGPDGKPLPFVYVANKTDSKL
jgi:hypothetical protein